MNLQAEVELPGLTPGDVEVQAAFGRVDDADGLHGVTTSPSGTSRPTARATGSSHHSAGADGRVRLHRPGAPALARMVDPAELGVGERMSPSLETLVSRWSHRHRVGA